MNLDLIFNLLGFTTGIALVIERLVEHFASPLLERFGGKWLLPYVGLILGLLVGLGFGIDLFTPLAESVGLQPSVPWAGLVLSGLLIGGGSNLIHDLYPTTVKG